VQDSFELTNDQDTADLTAFLFSFTGSDLPAGSLTDPDNAPGVASLDVPTAGAILDRFLHHAQVIAITGKSYRVKEAPVVSQENKKQRKSNEPSTAGAAS
jgi:hypothetical protein